MEIQEIKAYMKANKITYQDLAERTGLSLSCITKIFGGYARYPRIDTIQTIERALGIEEKTPPVELTEGEKKLMDLIVQLTDDEAEELSNYVDYLISKRK